MDISLCDAECFVLTLGEITTTILHIKLVVIRWTKIVPGQKKGDELVLMSVIRISSVCFVTSVLKEARLTLS